MGYELDYTGLCEHAIGDLLPNIIIHRRSPRGSKILGKGFIDLGEDEGKMKRE